MALFDNPPEIKKNKFTLDEAGKIFAQTAEAIDSGSVPAEYVQAVIDIAKFLFDLAKLVKA